MSGEGSGLPVILITTADMQSGETRRCAEWWLPSTDFWLTGRTYR
jgi:hypothetical protein